MEIKVVEVNINDIKPYDNNPRNNDGAVEATANSIKEFGWQQPIVVDKDGVIIVGHTRLKAAKELGLHKVPVVYATSLTPSQVKAYRLADNKTGELADWDIDKLNLEMEGLADIDEIDMSDFGFELPDEPDEVVDDDYEVELPEEPKSKLGQVYQLGNHRLMCGDSTDAEQVAKLMDGNKADLLITDPPYNVNYEGKTKQGLTIDNDSQSADEFHEFLVKAFSAAEYNMKSGASFYCWYASSEVVNFVDSLKETGYQVKQELIWMKNQMVLGRQDYQWQHEPCLYGWLENGTHSWYGDRKQTTILEFDKPQRNGDHPTMKPIPLFDYQIKNSSKSDDNVLDIFGGSGTTIMACEQNHRNAFVMEFDPRYVDVIINRWEEFTGGKAELLTN